MKTASYTSGSDLSDRKVAVCVIGNDGKIVDEKSFPKHANTYLVNCAHVA